MENQSIVVPARFQSRKTPVARCKACFDTGVVAVDSREVCGYNEAMRRSAPCTCGSGARWTEEFKRFQLLEFLCDATSAGSSPLAENIRELRSLSPGWQWEIGAALKRIGYKAILRSNYWVAMRLFCFADSGGCCERCRKSGALTLHHRTYQILGEEWRPQNRSSIALLCWNCHEGIHAVAKQLEDVQPASGPDLKLIFGKALDRCSMDGGKHQVHVPRKMR